MNPRKRRRLVWGDQPSCTNIEAATMPLDGLSLSLSRYWIRYQEDQFGDFCEPPETAPLRVIRAAAHDRESCGCVSRYRLAA
jgi:hypothetical protein